MFGKNKYFDIKKAVKDISDATGVVETASASAKLVGKGVANVGIWAATEALPAAIEKTPEAIIKVQVKQIKSSEISAEKRKELIAKFYSSVEKEIQRQEGKITDPDSTDEKVKEAQRVIKVIKGHKREIDALY